MAEHSDSSTEPVKPGAITVFSTLSFCVSGPNGRLRAPLDLDQRGTSLTIGDYVQDRYRLHAELGRGGMGRVYLARDERLDRLVAIKVVAGPLARRSPLEDALAHEARLGAGLNHPAIAAVYDFGFHRGRAFTVFEYVDGDALRDVLRRGERMPLPAVRAILGSLARALDFAHSRGIVHRDLKPENIRATRQGQFKILDLGLAQDFRRHQNWAEFAGTPAYASPEQAAGLPSDGRTDQYALAVIAYEMLTGRRPFEHADPWELLVMHRDQAPVSPLAHAPDLPGAIASSILRALAKDPNARFASCEEFATALGAVDHLDTRRRPAAQPSQEERFNIYLCHAGEDSRVARQLAQSLEQEGCSVWRYEQDALPGISYVTQTSTAIKQSDAVVLLISADSLSSPDVHREVHEAYQLGRPFLPALHGLSRQEFQQRQPDWQPMLGSAAMIDLSAGSLASAVDRLIKTLQLWNIPARPRGESHGASPGAKPRRSLVAKGGLSDGSRKIWASDANQIEIDDLGAVVFRNELVDDFLERRNKFFLSASKGLGKTLLLTFKRTLLSRACQQQEGAGPQAAVRFVPQGRPYLDFMSDVGSLSRQHDELLSDLLSAKRMWSLALSVSALSHHPLLMTAEDQEELDLFPRRMQQWLKGRGIEPTVVFKELLSQSVRDINRLIDESGNFLDHKLRRLHSATIFFIDKVDQALRQLSQEAWIGVQAGLVEAAWDMMNANSHIKIYASIRQEAFSNYESDIKTNLFGATTILRYSEDELRQMLDQLAQCYEGCESVQDFLTLNVVRHPRRPFPEDSFRYLRRHTLGRPRDLVIIASELSARRKTMSETQFCRLVNETSALGLVSNIFDEMRVFLSCLEERRERQRFFSLLPCNVLTRDEAIRVCCLFNGLSEEAYSYYQSHAEGLHHPFCDLHRVGLLGTIAREPDSGRCLQRFKQPHDFLTDLESSLPDSPYYLLHPALDEHIRQLRTGPAYRLFQHVIVGDGQPWEDCFDVFCGLERSLFTLDDGAAQDAAYELLNTARVVLASDRKLHLRSILEASSELKLLRQRSAGAAGEDLSFWLDELIGLGDR